MKGRIGRYVARTVMKTAMAIARSVGPLKDDSTFMRSMNSLAEAAGVSIESISPYKDSIWVYASINTIARNAAKVPILIVERDHVDRRLEKGPLIDLFKNPNPYMTTKLFMQAISIFLNIYGESILAMRRKNITETPKEIWPLNPSRFDHVIKKVGPNQDVDALVGWEYTGGSKIIPFSPKEILLLKYFNPDDLIRGLSPLKPSKLSVEQHYFSSVYNRNFFKQGVRTSGFITVEEALDDDTYNRMLSQFDEQNAGVYKAHKVALIEGGAKFTESKFTQKDMEFIQLNKMSRTEIFAVYGTNEVVLGIYDEIQSYEGSRAAHKAFWEEAMVPHLSYIEEFLNNTLFSQIEGGRYKMMFDFASVGALHDDYKTRIDTAKIMTNMGFPLNDVNKRLELGMPEYSWGDTWFVPWGAIPVEAVMANPFGSKDANSGGGSSTTTTTDDEDDDEEKPEEEKPEDESSKQLWVRYLSVQIMMEEMMKNKIKRYFFEQRKTIIENIAKDKTILFDFKKEHDKLQRLLGVLYVEAMKIGATMIIKEIGEAETSDNTFSLEFPEVVKYLQARLNLIPVKLLDRIKSRLDVIFALDSGKIVKQEEVRALYNKLQRSVGIIARNESSSILVVGRVIQMMRLGIKSHRWISARRTTSRSEHYSLNNKIVRIGESFSDEYTLRYPGDLMAPLHVISGCTCFTVPDIDRN